MNRFAIIIALCASCIGCASIPGYPTRVPDYKVQMAAIAPHLTVAAVDRYHAATGPEKRALRDQIITARILAIDLSFHAFEASVAAEGIRGNLVSDISVIAAGTAGAIVPAAEAKSVLSLLAAGITGTKGAVNKNVFYDQSISVLVVKMNASRKEVLVRIAEGLAEDVDRYPLMQGLIDVEAYYAAGTIPGALQAIASQAGGEIERSTTELKMLKEGRLLK